MFSISLLRSLSTSIKHRLNARLPVSFNETDISEKFIRGWGKGGQAVNKSSNAVYLKHHPTNTEIKCHMHRSLELNRKEARKILIRRLDNAINGENSLESIEGVKIKERKRQAAKKRRQKVKSRFEAEDLATGHREGAAITTDFDDNKGS